MSGKAYACRATTDAESTLASHYREAHPVLQSLLDLPATSWQHPLAFSMVEDRLYNKTTRLDWWAVWQELRSKGDEMLPDSIVRALDSHSNSARRNRRPAIRRGRHRN